MSLHEALWFVPLVLAFLPWYGVLSATLSGTVLIAAVLVIRAALRRRLPAQCFHLLWLLVAVRLLLPVTPSSPWSILNLRHPRPTVGPAVPVQTDAVISTREAPDFAPAAAAALPRKETWTVSTNETPPDFTPTAAALPREEPWTVDHVERKVRSWAWPLWGGGVLVQVVLLGVSALRMRRRLAGAPRIEEPRFLRLVEECRQQLRLRRRVVFLESPALPGPAVLGLWRPRLIMPPGLAGQLSDEELRFVLLHELAHIRRRDLVMLWLFTVVRILHWFNPLVWLAAHLARGDAELACDETVLRRLQSPTRVAYGEALLRLARLAPWRPMPLPMAGIAERIAALKTRLTRISGYTPPAAWRLACTVLVILGVGLIFGADGQPAPWIPLGTENGPNIPAEFLSQARDGKELFEKGDYRGAERIYEKILAEVPNNLYILSNLGVVRFRAGKYEKAEEALLKATKVAPEDSFSHCTLGIVYYTEEKLDDAVNSLARALALDPQNATAHNYLGIILSQKGRAEAAQKQLELACTINPNYADAHFNLALVLGWQNPPNKEKAREHYQRALALGAEPESTVEEWLK